MKKVISIILGMMMFMVPLVCFSVSFNSSYNTGYEYAVIKNDNGQYITYRVLSVPAGQKIINVSTTTVYSNGNNTLAGSELRGYVNGQSTDVGYSSGYCLTSENLTYQNIDNYTPVSSLPVVGTTATYTIVYTTCEILNASGGVISQPEPDVFNYTINPGDYCRFSNADNSPFEILVNVVYDNESTFTIQNFSDDKTMKVFTIPLLLFTTQYESDDHIDFKLLETKSNEPIVVTTSANMETLSTGGVDPPDTSVYTSELIDNSPNKAVIKNSTGEDQYITLARNGSNGEEYTKIQIENLSGGYYTGVGVSTAIKDTHEHSFKITPGERMTIYNVGGRVNSGTLLRYPQTDGFNVGFYTDENPFDDSSIPGTPVPIGDLPGYIKDGVADPPASPDDVFELLTMAKETIIGFFNGIATVFTSIFVAVTSFNSLIAGITLLPPEFTGLLSASVVIGLILRLVGR